ncbi:hypothetical protein CsatB_007402 [Cannabis sativa]|uniref:uncharacterized protein LOC133032686 n=1 Tax=Cannabis sativa TaxID=3483 RepID=UPI0029CA6F13|nr:uncharacterized protein LOC133032686 [Cannabis sativa]
MCAYCAEQVTWKSDDCGEDGEAARVVHSLLRCRFEFMSHCNLHFLETFVLNQMCVVQFSDDVVCFTLSQMVVPLLDTESAPHWFAGNVSMDNTTVEIRDSLSSAMHKRSRRSTCVEMLQTLDQLFAPVKPGDLNFSEFVIISSSKDYPQQQNGHDCGLFVMKYMESLFEENEIMEEVM